jgi:hypothetical protein
MSQLELAYVLSNSDKGIIGAWDTLSLCRNLIGLIIELTGDLQGLQD